MPYQHMFIGYVALITNNIVTKTIYKLIISILNWVCKMYNKISVFIMDLYLSKFIKDDISLNLLVRVNRWSFATSRHCGS